MSVVVPVRNEADNVAPLVAEIVSALGRPLAFEMIYVNDGSTDATAGPAGGLMAEAAVAAASQARTSCGQSAAVRSGVGRARRHRGHARRRRAERSRVPAGADRGARRRRPRRPRRRPAGRPQGDRLQEAAVAHRQRRAQRHLRDGTRDTGCGLKAFRASCSSRCPISTACIGSCRRWCGARATTSAMST